jgi:hypothetical protein
MKIKWYTAGGILLVFVTILVLPFGNILRLNYAANKSWVQLETEHQRRADLIPNLAVLLPYEQDSRADAVGQLADYRLAAIENGRHPEPRSPGRIGAVKARLNARFIFGPDHFLHDAARFTAYMNAQHHISRVSARLLSASGGADSTGAYIPFSNATRILEQSVTRIDRRSRQYNERVQNYNRSVTGFPGRWYAGATGLIPLHKINEQDSIIK